MEQLNGFNRTRMISSVVHKALSQILQNKISDPRIVQTTITEVELSKDMKLAKVFVTSSESEQALQTSIEQLNRARSYVRRCLSDHIELKYIPALRFVADEVPTRSSRVLELIDQASSSMDEY